MLTAFNIHAEAKILFCHSTHFVEGMNAEQKTNEMESPDLNGTWTKRTF